MHRSSYNGTAHKNMKYPGANSPKAPLLVDFEDALNISGHGRFHYGLFLICGLCFMSAGFQNGLNAYILPSARCDLQLTSSQMGLLNAVFIGGSMASAYLWGTLSDTVGRKTVIVSTLIIDSLITLLSTFSFSFDAFVACRFFNGFFVGAPSCIVFPYLGEFQPAKYRATSLCYVGFFWTLSWMLLPALAWLIIPLPWSFSILGLTYNSWRFYVAFISIPGLCSAFLLMFLYPESPKFLLATGRSKQALSILRGMYVTNTGNLATTYPVRFLMCSHGSGSLTVSTGKTSSGKSFLRMVKIMFSQIRALFVPPLIRRTALCAILLFTNMFGYFGLGFWLPELFNRFEAFYAAHPNQTTSVCELTMMVNETNVTTTSSVTEHCDGSHIDGKVFFNTLIIGAVSLLGNIISGVLASRLKRNILPISTMLIAGLAAVSIYFLRSSLQNLIVTCIFLAAISTANFVLTSVTVELFPTNVRGMAVCSAILSGRTGAVICNIVLGLLLDLSCEVPIFLIGSLVICGGLLGFLIPNSNLDT